MIEINCEQRSLEWHQARAGLVTASNFHRVITPTGKVSSMVNDLILETVASVYNPKMHEENFVSFTMQRGAELEDEARESFTMETFLEVKQVGFIKHEDLLVGCSPDGLIGDDAIIEIKCPQSKGHMSNLIRKVDPKYYPQIQGQLWLTERKQCYFVSYNPDFNDELKISINTIDRDEEYIDKLRTLMINITDEIKTFIKNVSSR